MPLAAPPRPARRDGAGDQRTVVRACGPPADDASDRPEAPADLLARLATDHGPGLRVYALQFLAGRPDAAGAADEAVQTALVRLARRLARDPTRADASGRPEDPAGWLFVTVRNLCRDTLRTRVRRWRRERRAARPDWFTRDPAHVAERALDGEAAAAALAALPAELREPVVLHLWGGRTFAQVADLTGTSRATAHRRYIAGLAELRRRLDPAHP